MLYSTAGRSLHSGSVMPVISFLLLISEGRALFSAHRDRDCYRSCSVNRLPATGVSAWRALFNEYSIYKMLEGISMSSALRKVDLNLLLIFDSIYRHGSVAEASRELALSPSALSHALNGV